VLIVCLDSDNHFLLNCFPNSSRGRIKRWDARGTGGGAMERNETLHQLVNPLPPQERVRSYSRMTSQGDQQGMNRFIPFLSFFQEREFIQYLSEEFFWIFLSIKDGMDRMANSFSPIRSISNPISFNASPPDSRIYDSSVENSMRMGRSNLSEAMDLFSYSFLSFSKRILSWRHVGQ